MRIGFIGDPHISKQGNLIDSETGWNEGLIDSLKTLRRACEDMRERRPDLVVITGDMFNHHSPRPPWERAVGECLEVLTLAGVPVHIVRGNHDDSPTGHALSCFDWIENVTVFDTPDRLTGERIGAPMTDFLYMPYPSKSYWLNDEELRLSKPEQEALLQSKVHGWIQNWCSDSAAEGRTCILVAHAGLDLATAGSESEYLFGRGFNLSLAQIPDEIDWVVLGHIHKPQRVRRVNRVTAGTDMDFVHAVGSTRCVNHGEENETKRCIIIDTEKRTVEDFPTAYRQYRTLNIDISDRPCDIITLPNETLDDCSGKIIRIKALARRGQSFDLSPLQRSLEKAGAYSVTIKTEYVADSRMDADSVIFADTESDTHEARLMAYLETRNIMGAEAQHMVGRALEFMQAVSAGRE